MPTKPLSSKALAELVQARIDRDGRGGQRRLAEEAGVSEATIHKLRHGGGCAPETFDAVCKALGLRVSWREKRTR